MEKRQLYEKTEDGYVPFMPNMEGSLYGRHVELRYKKSLTQSTQPTGFVSSERTAGTGWSTIPESIGDDESLWMTQATIEGDDTLNGTWSSPVRISGVKGAKGADGTNGTNGVSIVPITNRTVTVFLISPAEPNVPSGGSWNSETNELVLPTGGWKLNYDDAKSGDFVWQSFANFVSATGQVDANGWSKPICIWGYDSGGGTEGSDSAATEFIFYRASEYTDSSKVPDPNDPGQIYYTAEEIAVSGFVPTKLGWTDHPQGIDKEHQAEYVATRKRTSTDSAWGEFSVSLWSKWGSNGQDGDGVEYIFKLGDALGTAPDVPTPPSGTELTKWTNSAGKSFTDDDFVPDGWTDNPSGVSSQNPFEWVCTRKSVDGDWTIAFKGSADAPTKAALWSHYGDTGNSGNSIVTRYAVTDSPSVSPATPVQDPTSPGTAWSLAIPDTYTIDKALWATQATLDYNNEFAAIGKDADTGGTVYSQWSTPYLVSGIPGTAQTPNYKSYIYKQSESRPTDTPAVGVDLENFLADSSNGWKDYPDSTSGQWWQCVVLVNGTDGTVIELSKVLPVNGQNGIAQDGKYTELRFNKNDSADSWDGGGEYEKRDPGHGWSTTPPELSTGEYIWMILAIIDPTGNEEVIADGGSWSDPVRISGEKGEKGEEGIRGEKGPDGIPGVNTELRYCLGSESAPKTTLSDATTRTPNGWGLTLPTPTDTYPYVWCIQARITYSSNSDTTGSLESSWSGPIRLSGTNGISNSAQKSPIIYPAGIYDVNTTYTGSAEKTPYVLDTSTGKYYYLNMIGSWTGTEQSNYTPATSIPQGGLDAWIEMEDFDAIYAAIGIFGNALVGSAVFNKEYMFSQQGVWGEYSGRSSTHYELFDGSTAMGSFTQVIGYMAGLWSEVYPAYLVSSSYLDTFMTLGKVSVGQYFFVYNATTKMYTLYMCTGSSSYGVVSSEEVELVAGATVMCEYKYVGTTETFGPWIFSLDSTPTAPTTYSTASWSGGDTKATFVPNVCINFRTGAVHFAAGSFTGEIKATSGSFTGEVKATSGRFDNGTFTNMTATSGKIAGFNISGNGLTNNGLNNDAYIIFRNDTYGTFAGIGGNVYPSETAARCVARFENKKKGDISWGTYANVAISAGAQNSYENYAINLTGGWTAGLCLKTQAVSSTTTLTRGAHVIACVNKTEITITLPTMRTYDDGYVLYIKNLNGNKVNIKPNQSYHYSTINAYSTTENLYDSYIHYDQGSVARYGKDETVGCESNGDAFMLVYVRDIQLTKDSVTYKGGLDSVQAP